jgi:hypothetical protein
MACICSWVKRRPFDRPSVRCGQAILLAALPNCAGILTRERQSVSFQAIVPDAWRVRRQTERRGILGMPAYRSSSLRHAYSRTPEAQSDRCVWHAVTIAPRPRLALRRLLLLLPFGRFPGQIPQKFCTSAQIVRAQQLTHPPHQTCRRKIVLLAVVLRFQCALIPSNNMTKRGLCRGMARCRRRISSAAGCTGLGRLQRASERPWRAG